MKCVHNSPVVEWKVVVVGKVRGSQDAVLKVAVPAALADKTDLLRVQVEVVPVVVAPQDAVPKRVAPVAKGEGQKDETGQAGRRRTIPNALSNTRWNLMPTKMANSARKNC